MKKKISTVDLRETFRIWKKKSLNDAGYFIIFNGFLETGILSKISGGALKMYIFLGIKSNNSTGESFYRISTMARYFEVSDRTISNWIQELETLGIISRVQPKFNSVSYTYLRPYYSGVKGENNNAKSSSAIEKIIFSYLYDELGLRPTEFTQNYYDEKNSEIREAIESKFPDVSQEYIVSAWKSFYRS